MKPELGHLYRHVYERALVLSDEELDAAEKLAAEALPGDWRAAGEHVTRYDQQATRVASATHEGTRRFIARSIGLVGRLVKSQRAVERCLDSERATSEGLRYQVDRERKHFEETLARNRAGEHGPMRGLARVLSEWAAVVAARALGDRNNISMRSFSPEQEAKRMAELLARWACGEDLAEGVNGNSTVDEASAWQRVEELERQRAETLAMYRKDLVTAAGQIRLLQEENKKLRARKAKKEVEG